MTIVRTSIFDRSAYYTMHYGTVRHTIVHSTYTTIPEMLILNKIFNWTFEKSFFISLLLFLIHKSLAHLFEVYCLSNYTIIFKIIAHFGAIRRYVLIMDFDCFSIKTDTINFVPYFDTIRHHFNFILN